MKKVYRLLKSHEFNNVIAKQKSFSNSQYFIYFCKNTIDHVRIGISVPKKRFNKAILRNKIKRQIRSMLLEVEKKYHLDIVIIVKKSYLNNDYQKNSFALKNLLSKIFTKEENNAL